MVYWKEILYDIEIWNCIFSINYDDAEYIRHTYQGFDIFLFIEIFWITRESYILQTSKFHWPTCSYVPKLLKISARFVKRFEYYYGRPHHALSILLSDLLRKRDSINVLKLLCYNLIFLEIFVQVSNRALALGLLESLLYKLTCTSLFRIINLNYFHT